MKNVKHIGRRRGCGMPRDRQSTAQYTDVQRYRAVRKYGDARTNDFGGEFDAYIDSWLDHLKIASPADFAKIMKD